MLSIILLELLAVTSLLYSLLLIFVYFAPLESMAIIFLWTVGVCLFYHVSRRWGKVFRLSALLLLAPLHFFRNRVAMAFFIITVPLLIVYVDRWLHRGSTRDYAANLKKAGILYAIDLWMRSLMPNLDKSVALAAPFIFVYFLSQILLIRSIRHVEAGMEIRRLRKSNIRYLIFVGSVFLLTAVKDVRTFLLEAVKKFAAMLLWPVQMVLRLIEWFMDSFKGLEPKYPSEPWPGGEPPGTGGGEPPPLEAGEEAVINLDLLEKILLALLVAAAIFILYRMIVKAGERSYLGLSYVEEREYIKRQRKKRRRRLLPKRPPAEPGELVRYYYRKFLAKLAANKIELSPQDTSLDVRVKAETVFPHGPREIRDLYIPSRYGGKEADTERVKEMEQIYKDLAKGGQ
jgi:hypothetical protein